MLTNHFYPFQQIFHGSVQNNLGITIIRKLFNLLWQNLKWQKISICKLLHMLNYSRSLTLLNLTSEQLVQGSIELFGLYKMQLYSKSLFFELVT